MIRKRTQLTKDEADSQERSLRLKGYTKAFGSSELGLKPKEYVIAEELGSFQKDKRYRIAWNEE